MPTLHAPVPFDADQLASDQFRCRHCGELQWRRTQRMAHDETGTIACTSCVTDAAVLPDGTHWTEAVISRFRIRVPENTRGILPGVWSMTSRHMPLV